MSKCPTSEAKIDKPDKHNWDQADYRYIHKTSFEVYEADEMRVPKEGEMYWYPSKGGRVTRGGGAAIHDYLILKPCGYRVIDTFVSDWNHNEYFMIPVDEEVFKNGHQAQTYDDGKLITDHTKSKIEPPKCIPEGYEWTGELRVPVLGETFASAMNNSTDPNSGSGSAFKPDQEYLVSKHPRYILKKVESEAPIEVPTFSDCSSVHSEDIGVPPWEGSAVDTLKKKALAKAVDHLADLDVKVDTGPTREFVVGDVVTLSESSEYYGADNESNPHNIKGTVVKLKDWTTLAITVDWGNGQKSSYNPCDLNLVSKPTEHPNKCANSDHIEDAMSYMVATITGRTSAKVENKSNKPMSEEDNTMNTTSTNTNQVLSKGESGTVKFLCGYIEDNISMEQAESMLGGRQAVVERLEKSPALGTAYIDDKIAAEQKDIKRLVWILNGRKATRKSKKATK